MNIKKRHVALVWMLICGIGILLCAIYGDWITTLVMFFLWWAENVVKHITKP